ncbi:flagellar protein FliT [Kosakonia oryzendophytica]|uniref:Flagellar protein FliT n=1 Tax=Kosakonia oryzendophytica TaxID=1005665 RepID=A0A1C3YP50_9ENTR|nr:flagella biosynthesis regulatory protein FliT [Kosakonia oryzendophytica]AMO48366.1 Flagellar protein fliT [Enterobacter sp. FY-07]TDT59096.1 flagellar protein FliT [Enterobacter sp. AG5470]WBT60001.1 flagella biosynthesis regulatory protein FliT [Kosakonia oryzendophytica]SCB71875.1 flagellar protein FliT [Kosakonia oryzendophytica]
MEANFGLLHHYQQLLVVSRTMLSLAKEGRWDELIEHEIGYVKAVEQLTQFQDASEIAPQMQAQIRPLLQQILDNEVVLKLLLNQRMDELRTLVGQTSRQHNLHSTYGRLSGNILFPNEI